MKSGSNKLWIINYLFIFVAFFVGSGGVLITFGLENYDSNQQHWHGLNDDLKRFFIKWQNKTYLRGCKKTKMQRKSKKFSAILLKVLEKKTKQEKGTEPEQNRCPRPLGALQRNPVSAV